MFTYVCKFLYPFLAHFLCKIYSFLSVSPYICFSVSLSLPVFSFLLFLNPPPPFLFPLLFLYQSLSLFSLSPYQFLYLLTFVLSLFYPLSSCLLGPSLSKFMLSAWYQSSIAWPDFLPVVISTCSGCILVQDYSMERGSFTFFHTVFTEFVMT